MNTFLRLTSLAATVAALALTAAPAQAASLVAATPVAKAKVKILKGLTLTSSADLDFGTVVLSGAGAWSGDTVTVSTAGVQACTANLTCSSTTSAAAYNVTGSNNAVVVITVPASVTINNGPGGVGGASLTVTTTKSIGATVTMPNSGNTGVDFQVAGSIALASTTADGFYQGNINVTADYQ